MGGPLALEVLYDPADRGKQTDLDVVFVHGLGGDVLNTWKHPVSGMLWPLDLLAVERPTTRVMSFGYDGDMYENASCARIRDHARTLMARVKDERDPEEMSDPKRPIIFLAHCLGGLIVQQGLCFANSESERFGHIDETTCGIFMFGTPYFGTTKEQVVEVAKTFAQLEQSEIASKSSKPLASLAKTIIENSDDLKEIAEDFSDIRTQYHITAWYEMRKMPKAKGLVVDQFAASPMLGEHKRQVDSDHLNMCRFESKTNGTFKEVCKQIKVAMKAYNAKFVARNAHFDRAEHYQHPGYGMWQDPSKDWSSTHDTWNDGPVTFTKETTRMQITTDARTAAEFVMHSRVGAAMAEPTKTLALEGPAVSVVEMPWMVKNEEVSEERMVADPGTSAEGSASARRWWQWRQF